MNANPSLRKSPNLDDWIALEADGRIRVLSGKVDIGQRISTAVALIAAEELEVDPARIAMQPPDTDTAPDEGMTTGSNSIQQSGDAIRRAAATARRHLLGLAAARFGTDARTLEIVDGLVRDPATNRSATYVELTGGAPFAIPVDANATLKAPGDCRLIGGPAQPRGIADMVSGHAKYVQDLVLPGMRHARVVRPPHHLARLGGLDSETVARLEAAAIRIVRDGSFIAVAGDDEYAVVRAADRLARSATWKTGIEFEERDVFDQLVDNPRISLPVVDGMPLEAPVSRPPAPAEGAALSRRARYERPYQMHASIGPSAAMARDDDGHLMVWSHSQGIFPLRDSIAESLDLDPSRITVIHHPGPGCYGHNGADDAAYEAALVARALPGRPVLLKWTRDDEHAWEPYASAMAVDVAADLDASGRVIRWTAESHSDTHRGRPRPDAGGAGPARLLANRFRADAIPPLTPTPNMNHHGGLHRNLDPYYDFPAPHLVKHLVRGLPLRTSAMRCLGAVANMFALECFMAELAEAADIDRLEFRFNHLKDDRARAVLRAAADAIGWRRAGRPDDLGQGLAFARYKNDMTFAAVAVELRVDDQARVRLDRAAIAADSGQVIDRDGLRAQLEGGFLQAASWALYEQVRYDRDGVTSRDWETYPILGFDNVPEIDVIILDRPAAESLGAGEAAGGPTVAAIGNAIADATGLRLRRMPFDPDAIMAAARR